MERDPVAHDVVPDVDAKRAPVANEFDTDALKLIPVATGVDADTDLLKRVIGATGFDADTDVLKRVSVAAEVNLSRKMFSFQ